MYLTKEGRTYYRGDEQHHTKAPFLILVQNENSPLGPDNFRAIVRKVALSQLGPWMMGTARIQGQSITISGAYGNNGLPKTVSEKIYNEATPIPRALYNLWSIGDGWNSCGSEAPAMRKWALENLMK